MAWTANFLPLILCGKEGTILAIFFNFFDALPFCWPSLLRDPLSLSSIFYWHSLLFLCTGRHLLCHQVRMSTFQVQASAVYVWRSERIQQLLFAVTCFVGIVLPKRAIIRYAFNISSIFMVLILFSSLNARCVEHR